MKSIKPFQIMTKIQSNEWYKIQPVTAIVIMHRKVFIYCLLHSLVKAIFSAPSPLPT